MLSGRHLDLLDPSPLDLKIEDIAHENCQTLRSEDHEFERS